MTNVYIDPMIGKSGGAGTLNDPYNSIPHALNNMTRDAENGDCIRVLVKGDMNAAIIAAFDFESYGVPIADAPLMFEGYTKLD